MEELKGLKALKPICFFDTETTGIDTAKDRIVEIAVVKLFPSGKIVESSIKINPTIPIPKEVSDVHGITDEDVKDSKTFAEIAPTLAPFMSGCDLAGHNIKSFDIPLIANEFARVGILFPADDQLLLDSYLLECELNKRTLSACYKRYTGEELEGAHGALADTRASMSVLIRQCEGEDWTPQKIHEVTAGSNADWAGKVKFNDDGEPVWNFGSKYGKYIFEDNNYLQWFLTKGNPPRQTAITIELLLERHVAMFQAKSEKAIEEQETK